MELKDFIKKTLVEICDGIAEARSDIETKYAGNCIIAPVRFNGKPVVGKLSDITFDVAVHFEEEKSKHGKGSVNLKVVNGVLRRSPPFFPSTSNSLVQNQISDNCF